MRRIKPPRRRVVDVDPEDPAQTLDESGDFHVEPLAVSAQPDAEAADELDQAQAEAFATESEDDEDAPDPDEAELGAPGMPARKDVGELYGVHTPPAGDRELPESFEDSTLGETWLESLEAQSAEGGAEPEHELDVVDDSDADHRGHHATESGDPPVADKGSGGPGGL